MIRNCRWAFFTKFQPSHRYFCFILSTIYSILPKERDSERETYIPREREIPGVAIVREERGAVDVYILRCRLGLYRSRYVFVWVYNYILTQTIKEMTETPRAPTPTSVIPCPQGLVWMGD